MTQKPIATVSIPEGRESVKFEVMREHVRGGDWHNRYVRDAKTKEVLYYCVREPDTEHNDTKLIFHRGGKDGPIIAYSNPCPEGRKYKVDIFFPEIGLTIPFEHNHGKGLVRSMLDLVQFWGHKKEVNESGVIATYRPSPFEGNREEIKDGDLDMDLARTQDLIVVTALTAQERDEETQSPSAMYWQRMSEFVPTSA